MGVPGAPIVTARDLRPDEIPPSKEELLEAFRDGVREQAKIDPVFIPSIGRKYTMDEMRETLDNQVEGLSDMYSVYQIRDLVKVSDTNSPAVASNMKIDIYDIERVPVFEPSDGFLSKDQVVFEFTGLHVNELGGVAGDDLIWMKAIGIHEGQHCNQDISDIFRRYPRSGDVPEGREPDEYFEEVEEALHDWTIKAEIESDAALMSFLKNEGALDVAKDFKDIRTLSVFHESDSRHATQIMIGNNADHFLGRDRPYQIDAEKNSLYDEQSEASKVFKIVLKHRMGQDLLKEIDPDKYGNLNSKSVAAYRKEAEVHDDMYKFFPVEYSETLNKMLDDGKFEKMPAVEAYIKDFADTFERRVVATGIENAEKSYEEHMKVEIFHETGLDESEFNSKPLQEQINILRDLVDKNAFSDAPFDEYLIKEHIQDLETNIQLEQKLDNREGLNIVPTNSISPRAFAGPAYREDGTSNTFVQNGQPVNAYFNALAAQTTSMPSVEQLQDMAADQSKTLGADDAQMQVQVTVGAPKI